MTTAKMMIPSIRLAPFAAAILFAAVLSAPQPAQAQLQRVEQTVFGMDCAPCAHALEKRMNQLDGVESASVSLNEGKTTLELAPDNSITLEQLREAVKESGFSAEDATVQLAGTVSREEDKWVLSLPTGEQYLLEHIEATVSEEELSQQSGQEVILTGHVPEGEKPSEEGWTLHVSDFDVRA